MGKIEWNDTFSVNNPEIDAQHKEWIAIYNKMYDKMTNGDLRELRTLAADSLRLMLDYTRHHFEYEEAYMKQKAIFYKVLI